MAAQQAPTFEKGNLYNLPIIDIKPDPDQPRKYMDPQALEELAALGAEEKTRFTGEINQFSQELEARLSEIIPWLQPAQ
ncbi:MAG: hypothetical protein NTV58_04710 [Deltaproteobacteria bacterium]|nr:hypothetical protein [Deltaproteobacteria bacterium]